MNEPARVNTALTTPAGRRVPKNDRMFWELRTTNSQRTLRSDRLTAQHTILGFLVVGGQLGHNPNSGYFRVDG
jgi:hypothetical protein